MKQRIFLFIASLFAGGIFFLTSCTPGSCLEETNASLKAWFYSSETDKILAPDSITVYGLNKSSKKIYNKALKTQKVLLPLDASSQNCSFIIRINGKTDTLTVTYSTFPHLISKECGYTFYHSIDTPVYSKNKIKALKVRKATITTLREENIRIYY